ncbi:MAG: hypothetical protein C0429_08700 [Sphingopyxis sp.]|jgi:hypothetical protein|nr:hypothetical protein [Sphingopyxis sp.]
MNHSDQRLARTMALSLALSLIAAASPAHADWQSARTEGGMAAFNNDGKPAVPALIAACQKGTVFLYVNLAMDPEQGSRTIGFQGQSSARTSDESFVRDPTTGGWVTQPSAATLALFNDDEFTLSVMLNGQSIAGVGTQGYNGQGPDPQKGVYAALRPVFAACPNWRRQASAAVAPAVIAQASESKKSKRKKVVKPVPPQPASISEPPAQTASNPSRIPLAIGYYAYVEGTFSTCAKPVITPWYFDGMRFWEESDVTDPNHEYTSQSLKWEMAAADRFRITSRSRDERGQWDRQLAIKEYVITGPQSFTFVGTIGAPLTFNERHQLCTPSQLPAKARWYKERQ